MIRPSSLLALVLLAFTSSGCLTLLGGEEKIGAQAAKQVEAEMGLVDDPALVAYVREIGDRLAAHADREGVTWKFQVVDMKEPNAFALPGGFIYVSRGLLALVNDEDELAGVIGHEIGHVTAGHGNKRVTLGAPLSILTGIPGWFVGLVSPTVGNAIAGSSELVIAPFSRSQEREADRIGAELAAKAGYDPQALATFLATLGRFEELVTGEERRGSWLDSHPPSPERAADSREFASALERAPANPVARDRADLFGRLDGLVLGEDPGRGLLVAERFVHPELGFSLQFPPGWSVVNTPAAVGSQDPGGNAAVVLQVAASAKTLDQAIAEVQKGDDKIVFDRTTINGNPAGRTRLEQSGRSIDVTWIELGGHVYQIAGVAPVRQRAAWQSSFQKTAESFRAATPAEIGKIRARRLRIATATSGESLPELLERVGSAWEEPVAKVANDLKDSDIEPGRLVKFGREESWSEGR